jgi:hypothetical protein
LIERAVLPALILGLLSGSLSAQKPPTLSDADLQTEATNLRASLAGADEEAFTQILTHVTVERDPVVDTIAVYDIVVHYDPDRYSSPRVGAYPLSFENQFIHWGRRIALYTTRTSWKSGRFYLRDISTAHEAWIFTEDARLLLGPLKKRCPPIPPNGCASSTPCPLRSTSGPWAIGCA